MRSFVVAVALAGAAVAQSTTHTIMVGMGGTLTYSPSNITANPGDTVSFQFMAKNHTATQSTFANPCTQLVNTTVTPNIIGVSSGFMPVPANSTSFPSWSIQVQDATPLWFMCLQGNHCQQGMVFSINANANKTFDAFQAAAKASTATVAAPQTGGNQTQPSGGSGGSSTGTSGSPVTASPNGSPVSSTSTTAGASSTTKSSAGKLTSGASLAVSALALAFGLVL